MPPFDAITPVLLDPAAKNPGDTPLTICPASGGGPTFKPDTGSPQAQIIIPQLATEPHRQHTLRRWGIGASLLERPTQKPRASKAVYDAPWHVIDANHQPFAQPCAITQIIKEPEVAVAAKM